VRVARVVAQKCGEATNDAACLLTISSYTAKQLCYVDMVCQVAGAVFNAGGQTLLISDRLFLIWKNLSALL
jgi:hypothetical protein